MVRSAAFAIVALGAPLVAPSGTQPTTLRIEALSRQTVRVQVSSKPAAILSNDSAQAVAELEVALDRSTTGALEIRPVPSQLEA